MLVTYCRRHRVGIGAGGQQGKQPAPWRVLPQRRQEMSDVDPDGDTEVSGQKPSEFVRVFKVELTGVPVNGHQRKIQDSRFLDLSNWKDGFTVNRDVEGCWWSRSGANGGPVSLHSLSANHQKVRGATNI